MLHSVPEIFGTCSGSASSDGPVLPKVCSVCFVKNNCDTSLSGEMLILYLSN
jgi:hypothetical protein